MTAKGHGGWGDYHLASYGLPFAHLDTQQMLAVFKLRKLHVVANAHLIELQYSRTLSCTVHCALLQHIVFNNWQASMASCTNDKPCVTPVLSNKI